MRLKCLWRGIKALKSMSELLNDEQDRIDISKITIKEIIEFSLTISTDYKSPKWTK